MKKIAFVVIRYGKDINGGAELHCRMLAERLAGKYDVEVLTTCVKDYRKGGNEFCEGEETINGVLVRRFPADTSGPAEERMYARKAKGWRRLRHLLFRAGLLHAISSMFPIWKPGLQKDIEAQEHSMFHSAEMISFIRDNKERYAAFIVFTADYAPFYFTAVEAGDRTIAVPTLHNAKVSFRPSLTEAFSRIRYVGFNTGAEQRLAAKIFGRALGESGIISTGIETTDPDDWHSVKEMYGLPERYILYIGRVDNSKTGKILAYYCRYRKKYGQEALPLVMVGGIYDHPGDAGGIILTGFVSESRKRSILQHASMLVNPSLYESLSLVVLEALNDGIPVLVNGKCDVLKEHCTNSGGGIQYYTSGRDFVHKTRKITIDYGLSSCMVSKGKKYLEDNYNWKIIMCRLEDAIMKVSSSSKSSVTVQSACCKRNHDRNIASRQCVKPGQETNNQI